MDHLFLIVLLCFHACLFVGALWSPAGKGLTSWLSFVVNNQVFAKSTIHYLGQHVSFWY